MIVAKVISSLLLAISLPSLYLAVTSSRLLLKYENITKKAAKLSAEAARQLHKTRTTQSSLVLGCLSSTFTAAYGLQVRLPNWLLSSLIAAVVGSTYVHASNFWKGAMKSPLPGGGGYNDAVRSTETILMLMPYMIGGWGIMAALSLVFG